MREDVVFAFIDMGIFILFKSALFVLFQLFYHTGVLVFGSVEEVEYCRDIPAFFNLLDVGITQGIGFFRYNAPAHGCTCRQCDYDDAPVHAGEDLRKGCLLPPDNLH